MRIRLSAAVVCAVGVALAAPGFFAASHARQPPGSPRRVAIDADDIGGVVTGPNGPEAGVWVIAETHDLPVRYIKIVVTDDRGRYRDSRSAEGALRGVGARLRARRQREDDERAGQAGERRRDAGADAGRRGAVLPGDLLVLDAEDPDAGRVRRTRDSFAGNMTQQRWLSAMKNLGCVGCHQLGQLSTRTIPAALGTFASGAEAWRRRVQSGQAGEHDVRPAERARRRVVPVLRRLDRSHREGRAAARQAASARRASSATSSSRCATGWTTKQYLHDLISSDRRNPTVNGNGPLYGSPEYSSDLLPILDPVEEQGDDVPGAGARSAACRSASARDTRRRSKPLAAVGVLGRRGDLGHARQQPQLDVRSARAASGWRRRCAAPENPAFCQRGLGSSVGEAVPDRSQRRGSWRCSIRRRRSTRFVDTCFGTHHLQFGYDANDTLWIERRRPGARLGQHEDVRRDRRRREVAGLDARSCSTPTATASATTYVEPERAGRSGEGQAHRDAGFYAVMPSPVDGSIWGAMMRQSRRGRARRARTESAGDGADRDLQRAGAGLRRARRRHRQQRRRVGVAGERPPRQLRPAQVQGAAQRTEGDRRSLPGRLDVLPVSRARASRASARTAPSRATTPGSISTTRSASARTCRSRPAT